MASMMPSVAPDPNRALPPSSTITDSSHFAFLSSIGIDSAGRDLMRRDEVVIATKAGLT